MGNCNSGDHFFKFHKKNKELLVVPPKKIDMDVQIVILPHFNKEKWAQAENILNFMACGKIQSFEEFEKALLNLYNLYLPSDFSQITGFETLEKFFKINPPMIKDFFGKTLPFLAKLALELIKLFPEPIPLLIQDKAQKISFTKKQIACLLVNMFFGTIPNQYFNNRMHELFNFQFIFENFIPVTLQKIYFIFNYFNRLATNQINFELIVEYVRVCDPQYRKLEEWENSKTLLGDVEVMDEGGIEDFKANSIQVDFANKFIGGGCLSTGCVQEEIRFVISPECLPSTFIFECLKRNEAAYILGAELFSSYKGYGWEFQFDADFKDTEPKTDTKKRLDVNILALDAICFMGGKAKIEQFHETNVLRELNKALIGFKGDDVLLSFETKKDWVYTGKWGCGAFNGNSQLKFLIQWLAAAESGLKMRFYRKADIFLYYAEEIVEKLKGFSVGDVIKMIGEFAKNNERDLFRFILREKFQMDLPEELKVEKMDFETLLKMKKTGKN